LLTDPQQEARIYTVQRHHHNKKKNKNKNKNKNNNIITIRSRRSSWCVIRSLLEVVGRTKRPPSPARGQGKGKATERNRGGIECLPSLAHSSHRSWASFTVPLGGANGPPQAFLFS